MACLGAPAAASAGTASLRNDADLYALLSASPACCIIDARSARARQANAMPGALVYRDRMSLKPTSHAVVVAESDARALAVARTVAKASPHEVYAARGGMVAWQAVERRLQALAARPGSTKFGFVIPHNTCEQGTPLQVFQPEVAGPPSSKAR